jgi:hypothetical protein
MSFQKAILRLQGPDGTSRTKKDIKGLKKVLKFVEDTFLFIGPKVDLKVKLWRSGSWKSNNGYF